MRYIIKNILHIIKAETFLAVVIVLCVFSSAWVMAFSYGIYQNYNVQKIETELQINEITPTVSTKSNLSKRNLLKYLISFSDELCGNISVIAAWQTIEFYNNETVQPRITFRFGVRNGNVCTSDYLIENRSKNGILISGRLFSDEEESMGAAVALMPDYDDFEEFNDISVLLL